MPRISIQVKKNRLPEIARQLPEAADIIVQNRGLDMVEVAKRHSRYDTNRTAGDNSPHMRDQWEWHPTGVGEGELSNESDHVYFNEFGTRDMSAQPMARPALEEVGPKIISDFADLEKHLR